MTGSRAARPKVNKPRVSWVPDSRKSLARKAVNWARKHKMSLDPEQEWMLSSMMGLREDGRWQAFEVGINAPRQNGKGEVLMARELFGIFVLEEKLSVHSAHEFKPSSRRSVNLSATLKP